MKYSHRDKAYALFSFVAISILASWTIRLCPPNFPHRGLLFIGCAGLMLVALGAGAIGTFLSLHEHEDTVLMLLSGLFLFLLFGIIDRKMPGMYRTMFWVDRAFVGAALIFSIRHFLSQHRDKSAEIISASVSSVANSHPEKVQEHPQQHSNHADKAPIYWQGTRAPVSTRSKILFGLFFACVLLSGVTHNAAWVALGVIDFPALAISAIFDRRKTELQKSKQAVSANLPSSEARTKRVKRGQGFVAVAGVGIAIAVLSGSGQVFLVVFVLLAVGMGGLVAMEFRDEFHKARRRWHKNPLEMILVILPYGGALVLLVAMALAAGDSFMGKNPNNSVLLRRLILGSVNVIGVCILFALSVFLIYALRSLFSRRGATSPDPRLFTPEWLALERRFGAPPSKGLKNLYEDKALIAQQGIVLKQPRAGLEFIDRFLPLTEESANQHAKAIGNKNIAIAQSMEGDIYFVTWDGSDPTVNWYTVSTEESQEVADSLTQFVSWIPRPVQSHV